MKKPQLILIACAVLTFVLLLLLPKVQAPSTEEKAEEISVDESVEDEHAHELSTADEALRNEIESNIRKAGDPMQKIEWIDSLSGFWESRGFIHEAANELYRIAEILDDKASYFIAGDKYFQAFQAQDNHQREASLKKAMASYEKILEKNPDDLEVKTSLAVCYVEGAQLLGEAPMKGIGMLREVLQADPENINALINLGYFSTKSGQLDKAIARFEQVLEIDPEYLDAYLYLSDIYLKKGDKDNAIKQLEIYKEKLNDPNVAQQIEVYIEKVRNNNI